MIKKAQRLEKAKKLGAELTKGKKFFLKDAYDREFLEVDLKLVAGEPKEVSKDVAKLLKEKYPYLEVLAE